MTVLNLLSKISFGVWIVGWILIFKLLILVITKRLLFARNIFLSIMLMQWITYRFWERSQLLIIIIWNCSVIGLGKRIVNRSRHRKYNAVVCINCGSRSYCLSNWGFSKRVAIIFEVHLIVHILNLRISILIFFLRMRVSVILNHKRVVLRALERSIICLGKMINILLAACNSAYLGIQVSI